MFYKIALLATVLPFAFTASAQEKMNLFDKKLNLFDTAPKSTFKTPLLEIDPQLIAKLPKFKAVPDSRIVMVDAMPCIKPDLTYYHSFPIADPTKDPAYISDNMPNSFPGKTRLSLKSVPAK